EKIEGFFDACRAIGFNGNQGVIIPAANVKHLMLRPDVVAAVREGRFAIVPIDSVDEGIELLTGIPVGQPDGEKNYPAGTLNQRTSPPTSPTMLPSWDPRGANLTVDPLPRLPPD